MDNEVKLEDLAKQIESCRKCRLWQSGKAVPGEGPAGAKIMVIGEAPGKKESETGRPFVGASGKYLEKILNRNGFERSEIFITSVVKHRPPENRNPKDDELAACRIWWKKQVEVINPEIVLLLGRVACEEVLGLDFAKAKGRVAERGNRKFLTAYHPAAAMRFPRFGEPFECSIAKLKKISNKI